MWKRLLLAGSVFVLAVLGAELALAVLGLGAPEPEPDKVLESPAGEGRIDLFLKGPDDANHRVRVPTSPTPGTKRTVVLGGSTVWGHYVRSRSTISTMLECMLPPAIGGRHEVLNLGITGANAARVREVADYALERLQPDLLVVYSGHNELRSNHLAPYLERHEHPLRVRLRELFESTHIGRLAFGPRPPAEERGGALDQLRASTFRILERSRVEPVRALVHDDYERQIEAIVLAARARGVPVVIVEPASCGREYGPLASAFSRELTPEQRERAIELLRRAARAIDESRVDECAALLDEAEAIDPEVAVLVHLRGQVAWHRGEVELARELDLRKRDLDEDQQCFSEALRDRLHAVVRRHEVPLVEVGDELERLPQPGDPLLFLDHVHPSVQGQYPIARGIALAIADEGLLGQAPEGAAERVPDFQGVCDCLGITPKALHDTQRVTIFGDLNWAFFAVDPAPYLRRAREALARVPENEVRNSKLLFIALLIALFDDDDAEARRLATIAREERPGGLQEVLGSLQAHPRLRERVERALAD